MSKAGTSIIVFGVYLVVLGAGLIAAPNLILAPFGFAPTTEVWVHVLGAVTCALGAYYVQAARSELVPFFRMSVPVRGVVFAVFATFVAIGWAPGALALFGAVDFAGAIWTWSALRAAPQGQR
jgi:hypothetical protein